MQDPQQNSNQSLYDYDIQDQVRDLKIFHKQICQQSQESENRFQDQRQLHQSQTQLAPIFSQNQNTLNEGHTIYWQEAQQKGLERKYQVEVTKRLQQHSRELHLNDHKILDQTYNFKDSLPNQQNILYCKQENNMIIRKYDNPTIVGKRPRKQDKKQKAQEAMQQIIQIRQGGQSKEDNSRGQMQEECEEQSIFTITDKSTLYSMMPQRRNRTQLCKGNNPPKNVEEEVNNKQQGTQQTCILRATQECEMFEIEIILQAINVFGPILICQGETLNYEQIEFLYKPGFEQQLQRTNLFESALDFEYAEKPCEGRRYKIFYRTINTQQQLMVEKIQLL